MKDSVKKLFDNCISRYPELSVCSTGILAAYDAFVSCYNQKGKVLACGNGGSASDAEHIVGELMNKFRLRRDADSLVKKKLLQYGCAETDFIATQLQRSLPAISLVSQTSLITAIANDNGPDMIFAQQVYGYGNCGDILVALSTSGNSPNVVNAVYVANAIDMVTVGFTGKTGGKLQSICDITISVPSGITFEIQEFTLAVYHLLCAMVEEEIFS